MSAPASWDEGSSRAGALLRAVREHRDGGLEEHQVSVLSHALC